MAEDDFYVDDESPEEFAAAWREGERGVTKGKKDLNQRAKSVVDAAVAQLDDAPKVPLRIVWSGVTSGHAVTYKDPGVSDDVTPVVEYQVATSGT